MNRDYHILSVSELTFQIKELMEGSFPSVWIEGEMSNFLHHRSGHMYFTLKDDGSELRSVMFRGNNQFLRFKPENGMKIVAQGKISVYEQRGQYQLLVQQMEPAGIGTLYLAFEALKKQLSAEGLFDLEWKKEIPPFPKTVGIITSSSGAAIQDIIKVLGRRAPHVQLILRPTLVQGAEAAEEIVQAIEEFQSFQNVDVLIVGRGGGSLEDLWPFNEEKVARSIHACTIPIISAVGHETDISISDLVADVRAPTPSVAAELVSPSRENLIGDLEQIFFDLNRALGKQLQQRWQHLDHLTDRAVFQQPGRKVVRKRDRLETAIHQLVQSAQYRIKMSQSQLEGAQEILTVLNPQNVLERGYSIAMTVPEREIIRSARALGAGDPFQVQTARGKFSAVKTNDMKEK